jgi:hypothetical protein
MCVYAVARELEKLYSCLEEEQTLHCHSHLSEYRRQHMEFLKRAKLRTVQQTKNYDKIII